MALLILQHTEWQVAMNTMKADSSSQPFLVMYLVVLDCRLVQWDALACVWDHWYQWSGSMNCPRTSLSVHLSC